MIHTHIYINANMKLSDNWEVLCHHVPTLVVNSEALKRPLLRLGGREASERGDVTVLWYHRIYYKQLYRICSYTHKYTYIHIFIYTYTSVYIYIYTLLLLLALLLYIYYTYCFFIINNIIIIHILYTYYRKLKPQIATL